jgi:hypothetical protein
MLTWLVDDPSVVYLILGVLALVLGALWWLRRRPGYLIGMAVAAGLLVLAVLVSFWVDTDAKQIKRNLDHMAAAVGAHNVDEIFAYISDDFFLDKRLDKAHFKQIAQGYLQGGQVSSLEVWDFVLVSQAQGTATVTYKAKPKGAVFRGHEVFNCKATFVLDKDGQWRLKDFQLFDPLNGEALQLPF